LRTNVVLDDTLIEKALALSDAKTKRELINIALEEYVARRSRKSLLDLQGQIEFDPTYDHKALREGM
jgi:Arc/MetJ family transcription regulator